MNLIDIAQSWKASLSLFKKKNITLFLLVSLKTFSRAALLFFKYFSWLVVLDYVARLYIIHPQTQIVAWASFRILISFATILAARASLERKDGAYFWHYSKRVFDVLSMLLLPLAGYVALLITLTLASNRFADIVNPTELIIGDVVATFVLFSPLIIPFLAMSTFFLFDTNAGFKNQFRALTRGLLALAYYLPVMVVFGALSLFVFEVIVPVPFSVLIGPVVYLVQLMLHFFFFSLMANYYLKIKHGNYQLFFGA